MALKRAADRDLEIDVGAFADIAFLMIIFFILTTTIVQVTGRDIQIPASQQSDSKEEQKTKTITVAGSEIRYGEGENAPVVTIDELRQQLDAEGFPEKEEATDRVVIVECGDDVEWQLYFTVVTAVSRAGGVVAILEPAEKSES